MHGLANNYVNIILDRSVSHRNFLHIRGSPAPQQIFSAMSSIHSQRAKRWDTNPFIAEWLANAFEYCHKTAEGKQAFENWYLDFIIKIDIGLTLLLGRSENTEPWKVDERYICAMNHLVRSTASQRVTYSCGTVPGFGSMFSLCDGSNLINFFIG